MSSSKLLPAGTVSFDLPLGRLYVRVVDLPTTWEPFVARHYEPFAEIVQPERAADLVVTCRVAEGIVVPLPPPGGTPVIEVKRLQKERYRIRSHWQDGQVDLSAGTAELTLTDRGETELRMSLENFLRVACQLLLPDKQGFLFHSAGILQEGRCHLFFGHSGAGKSTVTALSEPRQALSDDMVLVDASGDRVMVHAVPFFGLYPLRRRVRGAYPVAAAFRLRQGQADRLQRLRGARAAATVSASVPFVQDLGLTAPAMMDLLVEVCDRVPVYDLQFTKSPRFWQLIDAELGSRG